MINIIILLITIFANSLLGLLILLKKRNNLSDINIINFLTGIGFLILWSIFNYLADNSQTIKTSLFWTRATFPASLFVIWFILWFSFSFPKKISNYTKINIIYFCVALFLSILSMTKQVISNINLEPGIGVNNIEFGQFYPLIMIFYLILVGNIIYNLFYKYKKLKGIERMQITYVIFGWSLFIISGLITNLILPFITGNANWSKFGPLLSIIMIAFTSYAIIRYAFLDIRIIIQKSLVYSLLLIIITGFYLLLISIIGFLFQQSTNTTTLISAGLTTIIGIFSIPIIKKYFSQISDKLFFKNKYNFSEAIHALSKILNESLQLNILEKKTIIELKKLLKSRKITLHLQNDPKNDKHLKASYAYLQHHYKMNKTVFTINEMLIFFKKIKSKKIKNAFTKIITNNNKIELFVFLKIEKKIIGLITLSPKISNDPYSKDDINLLKSVSYQIAVSIEKAKLYKKLENYSQDLENKVEARTSEIAKLQNEQKQIMLDISHGLQTPLTVIKGELELLKKESPKSKELLVFEKSIDRISKFINDLLFLAKLETKQEEIEQKKINLSLVLDDMVEYFEIIFQNKKIIFQNDIKANIFIKGNIEKIEELVSTLMSNSIKYIGQGNKIKMVLRTINKQVFLSIKDNGVGISKHELPLVLNRFYRAKNVNTIGSGLGLSISKKIVELHNGKIKIISKVGKGTEIIINFKLLS